MPHAGEGLADPAVGRVEGRERNPGHRRRQRERQVHRRVKELAPREIISHQHPGDEQAEHRVEKRCRERQAEADAQRRRAPASSLTTFHKPGRPQRRRAQDQGARAG